MLIQEVSNKMSLEYCQDSNGSLCHRGISWNFQSILESGIIPGGKENDRARQSVLCTALNPFGRDPEEEPRNFDYNVPQKQHCETHWKRNQYVVFMIKESDSGRQKSFSITTYTTVPGNCIDRVTSLNGDRVLFERLPTPRPPPKVTLKSYWQIQHQQQLQQPQQPKLEDDTQSLWRQRATWKAEQECETIRNTLRKGEQPGNWCYPLLKRQMILISL